MHYFVFHQLPCGSICEAHTEAPYSAAPTGVPTVGYESMSPTDCLDVHGISEDDIIDQIGSDAPLPEDAIKIVHGDESSISIGEF